MLLLVLFSELCLVAYSLFVGWAAWHFYQIPPLEEKGTLALPFVTLIIPARNEAANLAACLDAIAAQDYPQDCLEVLIVDDASEDETSSIAGGFLSKHAGWQLLNTRDSGLRGSKKTAITWGVQHARGAIILQTDADTQSKPGWVRAMVSNWAPEEGLRSGPVWLKPVGGFFGKLQSLEYLGLVTMGAGSIQGHAPNMVNGANLAYSKEAFLAVDGFKGVDHFASGDDEMLLQKLMTAGYGARFVKNADAIVMSSTQSGWDAFAQQRLRWVSKARHYHNRKTNVVQLIAYAGFWFFPFSIIYSFLNPQYAWLPLAGFGMKCLFDVPLMILGANFFNRLSLLIWFLPLQLGYIPYVLWVGLAGNLIKTYRWKGREVI